MPPAQTGGWQTSSPASARELSRVLISVAAWDSMELNTLFSRRPRCLSGMYRSTSDGPNTFQAPAAC